MHKESVSVVVPVYNEAENLQLLNESINKALEKLNRAWEIVYVDDGSKDNSYSLLTLFATDKRVKVIKLNRNFGQSSAIAAGVQFSSHEIIILLDADLQNDPEDIPLLLDKIDSGYDVVSGWRKKRADPFFSRRLPSIAANWLISKLTGIYLHDYGCTLKAYRKKFISQFRLYGEMHRLIPAYLAWNGAKIIETVVQHHPRKKGKSKYGLNRIFKVVLDLLTTKFLLGYFSKPSYIFGGLGLILFSLGIVCGIIVLINKFAHGIFAYRQPLLLLSMFLGMVGIQFIAIGLLAELIVRTFYESGERKPYVLQTTLNLKTHNEGE